MDLRIELRRAGMSRVAEANIPLVARAISPQGRGYGADLLAGLGSTDVVCGKQRVQHALDARFGRPVSIEWIDATGSREPGEGD